MHTHDRQRQDLSAMPSVICEGLASSKAKAGGLDRISLLMLIRCQSLLTRVYRRQSGVYTGLLPSLSLMETGAHGRSGQKMPQGAGNQFRYDVTPETRHNHLHTRHLIQKDREQMRMLKGFGGTCAHAVAK